MYHSSTYSRRTSTHHTHSHQLTLGQASSGVLHDLRLPDPCSRNEVKSDWACDQALAAQSSRCANLS